MLWALNENMKASVPSEVSLALIAASEGVRLQVMAEIYESNMDLNAS